MTNKKTKTTLRKHLVTPGCCFNSLLFMYFRASVFLPKPCCVLHHYCPSDSESSEVQSRVPELDFQARPLLFRRLWRISVTHTVIRHLAVPPTQLPRSEMFFSAFRSHESSAFHRASLSITATKTQAWCCKEDTASCKSVPQRIVPKFLPFWSDSILMSSSSLPPWRGASWKSFQLFF